MCFLTVLCIFSIPSKVSSQYIDLGINLGGITYQGDISPLKSRVSIEGAKFNYAAHIGYSFNEIYTLKLAYSSGTIAASDQTSFNSWRKSRNLSFRTDIKEWSLTNEVEVLNVMRFFRKYNLRPFIKFGVAVFNFNPQGLHKGEWYDLRDYSTEGQGLPNSNQQPYSLTQISIPLGVGVKYSINDYFNISLDITPRITFTDYLDDVSADYPDFELLRQYKGDLAVALSYKGNLLEDGLPPEMVAMSGRGNSKDNDWYFITSIGIQFVFDPRYELKKKRTFNGARKCAFF